MLSGHLCNVCDRLVGKNLQYPLHFNLFLHDIYMPVLKTTLGYVKNVYKPSMWPYIKPRCIELVGFSMLRIVQD